MDANVVRDPSLSNRDDGSADDGGNKQTRAVPVSGPSLRGQSEYAWEHDGIEATTKMISHSKMPVKASK